jgi:hypothetical protein
VEDLCASDLEYHCLGPKPSEHKEPNHDPHNPGGDDFESRGVASVHVSAATGHEQIRGENADSLSSLLEGNDDSLNAATERHEAEQASADSVHTQAQSHTGLQDPDSNNAQSTQTRSQSSAESRSSGSQPGRSSHAPQRSDEPSQRRADGSASTTARIPKKKGKKRPAVGQPESRGGKGKGKGKGRYSSQGYHSGGASGGKGFQSRYLPSAPRQQPGRSGYLDSSSSAAAPSPIFSIAGDSRAGRAARDLIADSPQSQFLNIKRAQVQTTLDAHERADAESLLPDANFQDSLLKALPVTMSGYLRNQNTVSEGRVMLDDIEILTQVVHDLHEYTKGDVVVGPLTPEQAQKIRAEPRRIVEVFQDTQYEHFLYGSRAVDHTHRLSDISQQRAASTAALTPSRFREDIRTTMAAFFPEPPKCSFEGDRYSDRMFYTHLYSASCAVWVKSFDEVRAMYARLYHSGVIGDEEIRDAQNTWERYFQSFDISTGVLPPVIGDWGLIPRARFVESLMDLERAIGALWCDITNSLYTIDMSEVYTVTAGRLCGKPSVCYKLAELLDIFFKELLKLEQVKRRATTYVESYCQDAHRWADLPLDVERARMIRTRALATLVYQRMLKHGCAKEIGINHEIQDVSKTHAANVAKGIATNVATKRLPLEERWIRNRTQRMYTNSELDAFAELIGGHYFQKPLQSRLDWVQDIKAAVQRSMIVPQAAEVPRGHIHGYSEASRLKQLERFAHTLWRDQDHNSIYSPHPQTQLPVQARSEPQVEPSTQPTAVALQVQPAPAVNRNQVRGTLGWCLTIPECELEAELQRVSRALEYTEIEPMSMTGEPYKRALLFTLLAAETKVNVSVRDARELHAALSSPYTLRVMDFGTSGCMVCSHCSIPVVLPLSAQSPHSKKAPKKATYKCAKLSRTKFNRSALTYTKLGISPAPQSSTTYPPLSTILKCWKCGAMHGTELQDGTWDHTHPRVEVTAVHAIAVHTCPLTLKVTCACDPDPILVDADEMDKLKVASDSNNQAFSETLAVCCQRTMSQRRDGAQPSPNELQFCIYCNQLGHQSDGQCLTFKYAVAMYDRMMKATAMHARSVKPMSVADEAQTPVVPESASASGASIEGESSTPSMESTAMEPDNKAQTDDHPAHDDRKADDDDREADAGDESASTVQSSTVPDSTVSESTVQGNQVPASTVPAGTVQAGTVPASTDPVGVEAAQTAAYNYTAITESVGVEAAQTAAYNYTAITESVGVEAAQTAANNYTE